jgi:hypothetical protein
MGLAACGRGYVNRLVAEATRFEAALPWVAEGRITFYLRPSARPADTLPAEAPKAEMPKPEAPGSFVRLRAFTTMLEGPDTVMLPMPASGLAMHHVRLELGPLTLYEGPVKPQDELVWLTPRGRSGAVQFKLNGTNLPTYSGPVTSLPLTCRVPSAAGAGGRIPFEFVRENSDELRALKASADYARGIWLGWTLAFFAFSFLALCAMFAGAESHPARGFSGMPPRRFAYPVATTTLVAWPLGLGLLSVGAVYWVWSRLLMGPLLPAGAALPDTYCLLLLWTGFAGFQALVWGLPALPRVRAWLIGLLVFTLAAGASMVPAVRESEVRQILATGLLAAVFLAGIATAWLAVHLERHGHWASLRDLDTAGLLGGQRRPSRGRAWRAFGAQLWLEWRRNVRFPLGLMVAGLALCVGGCWLTRGSPTEWQSTREALFATFASLALIGAAIAGLNLARDGSSGQLMMSSFVAARPVSVGSLVTAKVLAGLLLWAGTMSCVGLAAAVAHPDLLGPLWPATVLLVLVGVHACVGILPLGLTGRIPGFPWSLLPLLLVYGGVFSGLDWFSRHPEQLTTVAVGLAALAQFKLFVSFWAFRRSLQRRLVARRFVAGCAGIWGVAVLVLVAAAWLSRPPPLWDLGALPDGWWVIIPGAVVAVPLARIALSPLALAWNRHR